MTDKELRKLNRAELLEILVSQQKEIDRLNAELYDTQSKLYSREISMANLGSLAEASLAMTDIFEEAQKAADIYLENIFSLGSKYIQRINAERLKLNLPPIGEEEAAADAENPGKVETDEAALE